MSATDDGVRELHGGTTSAGMKEHGSSRILVRETDSFIVLEVGFNHHNLTPASARYLAAKLYRLSRRIRQRTGA